MPKPSHMSPLHCCLAAFRRVVPTGRTGVLLPALVLSGCHGAIWAHFAVLAISVGIFVGTVSLPRPPQPPSLGRQAPPEPGAVEQGWSQAPPGR